MKSIPQIETLLPQRGPMRLLDRLLDASESGARGEAVVSPGWPTCLEDEVDVSLAVELVAQTAAAWLALRGADPDTQEPGMLVGVREAHLVAACLRVGDRLEIAITEGWRRADLRQVSGRVLCAGLEVASAEVLVVRGATARKGLEQTSHEEKP